MKTGAVALGSMTHRNVETQRQEQCSCLKGGRVRVEAP